MRFDHIDALWAYLCAAIQQLVRCRADDICHAIEYYLVEIEDVYRGVEALKGPAD